MKKASFIASLIHYTGIVLTSPPRQLVNQNNIAVLSDKNITVDINEKIKQYLLETGIYAERKGHPLEEHGTRE